VGTTEHQVAMIQGEPIAQQGGRLLSGWLPRDEAVQFLLGGRPPAPNEDVTAPQTRARAAHEAVATRPSYDPQSPIVTVEDRTELDAVAARADVQAALGQLTWRAEMVDLRQVQTFQKLIKTDGLDARIAPVVDQSVSLMEFCLPAQQPEPPQGTFADVDGKGFTVSSLNPNLRIAAGQASRFDVAQVEGGPTIATMALSILVYLGPSYLQLAAYRGRYFLRDGYHRAAALLRAEIFEVPCIFIEAASWEQVQPPQQGFFSYEVCFAERPPLVADFWRDEVADDVLQPAVRKVIRVRGDEFVVQG